MMTVQEALSRIHSVACPGALPGLERIRALLSALGDPQKKLRCIHIAGTNGKGSTAAMTAAVLLQAGVRTGLYTSPFINRFQERIQISGEQIGDEDLVALTELVLPLAEAMEPRPTEFEVVTALAFTYFAQQNCQAVVVEVGLGGLVDATNVIEDPLVSVITNIGLDHTELLGDTLEKIAANKAGIIKPHCPAVIYRAAPSVEQVFEDRCRAVEAPLYRADFDSIRLRSHGFEGQVFDAGGLSSLRLPLLGAHQMKNCAVVLKVLEVLRQEGFAISEDDIRLGLESVVWPGRFELLRKKPLFLVDGGHNPQCIEALADNIRDYLRGRPLTVLTGVLADKDYNCMYANIAPFVREFITVTPPSPRAMSAADLKTYLERFGKPIFVCDSIPQAVELALEKAGETGVVLAYGSLYMVGDIRNAVFRPY